MLLVEKDKFGVSGIDSLYKKLTPKSAKMPAIFRFNVFISNIRVLAMRRCVSMPPVSHSLLLFMASWVAYYGYGVRFSVRVLTFLLAEGLIM